MSTTLMERTKALAGRLEALCKRHRAHSQFTRAAIVIRDEGLDAPLNWLNLSENPAYSAEENKMRLCLKSFKKVRQGHRGEAKAEVLEAELGTIETLVIELEAVINVPEPVVKAHWTDNLSRENLSKIVRTLTGKAATMSNKLLGTVEEHGLFLLVASLPLLLLRAKEAVERKLVKVAKALVVLDATATGIALTSFALSVVGATLVCLTGNEGLTWLLLTMPLFAFLRWSLDTIETLVAQETGTDSPYRRYRKTSLDLAADVSLFIGIALSGLVNTPLAIACLLALLLNYNLRLIQAKSTGNENGYSDAVLLKQFRQRLLCGAAVAGALLTGIFGGGAGFVLDLALVFISANLVLNIVYEHQKTRAQLNPSETCPAADAATNEAAA